MTEANFQREEKPNTSHTATKRFLMLRVAPFLILQLVKTLDFTWRYQETNRHYFENVRSGEHPLIGAFFHSRIFPLLRFMSRPRNGKWISMCSKSLDGEAMAKVEEALGLEVVRGSSGRDGLPAIVEMIRRVRKNTALNACLAIDGSKGPRERVQGGIISLAQRTTGMIVPMTASAQPGRVFTSTWDHTLLPLPFARIEIVYGEPIKVPVKLGKDQFEQYRCLLETRLKELQQQADMLIQDSNKTAVSN